MSYTLSRRTLISATAAVVLVENGLMRPAVAEPQFTVGAAGGTWMERLQRAFMTPQGLMAWEGKNTVFDAAIDSVLAGKIVATCNNPTYSAASVGQSASALAGAAGCASAYDPALVPNLKDIPASATMALPGTSDVYWASYLTMLFAPVYNTKHATRPTTLRDLWSAKYKGKVGVPAYAWNGSEFLHAANKVFGGTEDNITPGIEALADLVKNNKALVIENTDQGAQAFTREEIIIMPFWNGRMFRLREAGVPLEISYVPGTIQLGEAFMIPKHAKFGVAAHKLVNSTLDPAAQVEFSRLAGYPPTNMKAQLSADIADRAVSPRDLANVVTLNWVKINQHRAAHLERWNREVLA